MTGIFDGMGPLLAAIFGGEMTVYPSGGGPVEVTGSIRDKDFEVESEDGDFVLVSRTVLRLTATTTRLVAGDLVVGGDGRRWRVIIPMTETSPAPDRTVMYSLRKDQTP